MGERGPEPGHAYGAAAIAMAPPEPPSPMTMLIKGTLILRQVSMQDAIASA